MIENAHKHLERAEPLPRENPDRGGIASRPGAVLQPVDHHRAVSFMCDLHVEGQAGRLFSARLHKTFAMAAAAILSVTLVPALMVVFVRGKDHSGAQEPDQPFPDLDL